MQHKQSTHNFTFLDVEQIWVLSETVDLCILWDFSSSQIFDLFLGKHHSQKLPKKYIYGTESLSCWTFFLIITQSRLKGYHQFYKTTDCLTRLTSKSITAWSVCHHRSKWWEIFMALPNPPKQIINDIQSTLETRFRVVNFMPCCKETKQTEFETVST